MKLKSNSWPCFHGLTEIPLKNPRNPTPPRFSIRYLHEFRGQEYELDIGYQYHGGWSGTWYEPPEGPEVDIYTIEHLNRTPVSQPLDDSICDLLVTDENFFQLLVEEAEETLKSWEPDI